VLDVEWAHALAPGAKLVIVEARTSSISDLLTAVNFARNLQGVSVVSMSFGWGESSGESSYDSTFTTPAGHTGITFIAASGDRGAWSGVSYPASSPGVLAVGGTTLRVDAFGNHQSESGWGNGSNGASGGGYSNYEPEPGYQYGVQRSGRRTVPDVSMDADPNTGCSIYFTAPSASRSVWTTVGGTSASAPMWAALIAIADQGHALGGRGTLDGASQTLPALYSAQMTGDFHDVTQGFNGYYAGYGYDLVTGRGSPRAFNIVRDLVQVAPSTPYASRASAPSGGIQVIPGLGAAPQPLPTFAPATYPGRFAGGASPLLALAPSGIDDARQTVPFPSSLGPDGHRRHEVHDLALELLLIDPDPVRYIVPDGA
jgi:subtilase family serine protease